MCEEEIMHMGKTVTVHNGYVMLPIEHTRLNVEGGRVARSVVKNNKISIIKW